MTTVIDEYLEKFEGAQLESLQHLRATISRLLPHADECLKYKMPAFTVGGKTVAGFDGFKNHNSYFPHSGGVIAKVEGIPTWCEADRGTLRFPIGCNLPVALVKRLIAARLDEIATASASKRSR